MSIKMIYNNYMRLNPLLKLLVNIFCLSLLWILFYVTLRDIRAISTFYQTGTVLLTNFLLHAAEAGLDLLGYDATVYVEAKVLAIPGSRGVMLDLGCLGRNTMGLFAGFIIAFPGTIKSKLWYVPMGVSLIMFVNVTRIIILSLSLLYTPEGYFRYNHHDIFKYAVYILIFFMWLFWIKRFSVIANKKQSASKKKLPNVVTTHQ